MVVRTVAFPLELTTEQECAIQETISLYSKAWNHCVDVAWGMKRVSAFDVHKQTYKKLKQDLGLKSQYLCSARNRAAEIVKAMRVLERKGKRVSKPSAAMIPIRLDARTLSFDKEMEMASIATQHGRIKIPLFWHKQALRYRGWRCQAGEIGINRDVKLFFRLVFEKATPEKPERTGNVTGINRGILHPVVASNNKFLGKPKWKEHERKLLSLRSKLQSKGTASAKRHLKELSGRQRRFKENCDRIVAKELLRMLVPGDTIVLERLTDIRKLCGEKGRARKKHRANMSRWSFKRLENAINCGSELSGVYVEYIDPAYTSQICSRCKIVLKSNRKTQSLYSCSCGLRLNADLNAARNIENLWCVANGGTFGSPVNRPIVADSFA